MREGAKEKDRRGHEEDAPGSVYGGRLDVQQPLDELPSALNLRSIRARFALRLDVQQPVDELPLSTLN